MKIVIENENFYQHICTMATRLLLEISPVTFLAIYNSKSDQLKQTGTRELLISFCIILFNHMHCKWNTWLFMCIVKSIKSYILNREIIL